MNEDRMDKLEEALANLAGKVALLTQQVARFVEASLRSFTDAAERDAGIERNMRQIDRRLDELEAIMRPRA